MNKKHIIFSVLFWCLLGSTTFVYGQSTPFKDLDYSYDVHYQQVENNQRIAYVDEGEGDPIILIHGLGSYVPAWRKTIPTLAKNHRVVVLDLPGYGKSSKEVDSYSMSFFAKTVAQLQDSLNISRAVWAGHSMGGQIAMRGILKYPDKIKELILISPAGFEEYTSSQAAVMKRFVTPASIKSTPEKEVRKTFKKTFYRFPNDAQFMIEDRLHIREAPNFDLYARAYAQSVQAMLDGPVFDELSTIKQDALIIYGRKDALIPNKQLHPQSTTKKVAEKGYKQLPNSQLKMINKAGHFVQFEKSGAVNNAIAEFLNR